ncbi:MAG: 1-deoxy-D-xylulose-5-phosphate reductoisomerase [Bacillota bacterium]|nr:1-deoxy-D-xylulose-5-phosphate reductoisomerase [Bacillota bacterium]
MKKVAILGVTGSIGTQTLDVISNNPENFSLVAVSANQSWEKVIKIIEDFNPQYVAMMDKSSYEKIYYYCKENHKHIEVLFGIEGLNCISSLQEVDIVVTSVVGMVGLVPTITAIEAGKDIALANKETLVVGGELVINKAKKHGVNILPVDSEHCAIFQCLQGNKREDVSKLILTASGGSFRGRSKESLGEITVEQALKHPNWSMGKKISIDSSTLMNKGLEVIEAHWLFGMSYDNIEVVIHPESIIHSMVEYIDGSVIAQLGSTDMRLPIQYAMNYPERKRNIADKLDFYKISKLTFEKPDTDTFRCLKLAYEVGRVGGNMPTILNAANEIAVELFLNRRIKFLQIEDIINDAVNHFEFRRELDIDSIISTDISVRKYVKDKYFDRW